MSRFNTAVADRKPAVRNVAGGRAFQSSDKAELVSVLLTNFVKDEYYRSQDDLIRRIEELVELDPLFAAKAAVFARNEFGMRTATHIAAGAVAVALGGTGGGYTWTRPFFRTVISRPDDALEILGYYASKNDGKIKPMFSALKRGIADRLTQFDLYQLNKYKAQGKEINLYDVINLVRPRKTEAINAFMSGEKQTADTWEVAQTQAGQIAKTDEEKQILKADAWRRQVKERKLGYFALLRNLRNIKEQAPDVLPEALASLTNPGFIRSSKVLPFRFATAIEQFGGGVRATGQQASQPFGYPRYSYGIRTELGGTVAFPTNPEDRLIVQALTEAMDIALSNVPPMPNTLVAFDTSGSMRGEAHDDPRSQAAVLAAALAKSNNADICVFADEAGLVGYNPGDTVSSLSAALRCGHPYGHGTNFASVFEGLERPYDRIVLFSDEQSWQGDTIRAFNDYKRRTGATPWLYNWNVRKQDGTTQFPENKVATLAGFSEKVFDLMRLIEQDRNALVNTIEAVEFS